MKTLATIRLLNRRKRVQMTTGLKDSTSTDVCVCPSNVLPIDLTSKRVWLRTQKAGYMLHVLTKSEITEYRRMGYIVKILDRVDQRKGSRGSRKRKLEELFIVLISHLADVAKEANSIREELANLPDDGDGGGPLFNLFQPFVDENKLANCFFTLYQRFFGVMPKEMFTGDYNEPVDFAAYLFILVEREKLGNGTFSEKGMKPFFEYIELKVTGTLGKSERTFRNRLKETMKDFRDRLEHEPANSNYRDSVWARDPFVEDYRRVRGNFHKMDYYRELNRLKNQT